MKRRLSLIIVLVAIIGLGAAAILARRGSDVPQVNTVQVSRGSVVAQVSATGTLEAVDTVQVGTQVSGTILSLGADFNSIVKKGQVLARLDPSLIQADVARAHANLLGAEADGERLRVMLVDSRAKLSRAQELWNRQLLARTDLDAAQLAVGTYEAQVKASDAQVRQARAAVAQAQVNLQKTVILSPIDGIVISRDVEVGQTVAASLQAPTLFTIAADLTQMQLKASIDESDVGRLTPGQPVTFRVDAYPNDQFSGRVRQVRLNPVVEQNVVTYAAIISAANPALKLKPGMTATLGVEITRRDNVLRVPSSALRFKPSPAVLAALGQPAVATGAPAVSLRPVGTAGPAMASTTSKATVWVFESGQMRPVTVSVGTTDGNLTEVFGDIGEGTVLATSVNTTGATTTRPATSNNPLLGSTPQRRM